MPNFKVSFYQGDDEVVEAGGFALSGEWFVFTDGLAILKQIRSSNVERIDRL